MPPIAKGYQNEFTVEDAKRGVLKRGDFVCDKVSGNTTRGLFVGVSKSGHAWIYWCSHNTPNLSTNSIQFKQMCRSFDTFAVTPVRQHMPKFHTFETLKAGKGKRGEIIQVNTTRGIYVGTTERGGIWVAWNANDQRDPDYLAMCERFDQRNKLSEEKSSIRIGNSKRDKETRTA